MLQGKQQQKRKHWQKHIKVKSNSEVIGSAIKESLKSLFKTLNSLWCPQVVRKAVSQKRGVRTECPVPHGAELCPGGMKTV